MNEVRLTLQEILRTLLHDPDLVVESCHAGYVLTNAGHHSIRIDVLASDGRGRQLALELQKVTDDEIYPPAVFEAATMVVHSLLPGQSYHEADKVIVIFFTQKDLEGEGRAAYRCQTVRTDDPGKVMRAASEYASVNGEYRDDNRYWAYHCGCHGTQSA